jgi:hypothetical protein
MEKERRNEIVTRMTTLRNGSKREYVTTAIEKGSTITFSKIGEPQSFNGFDWDPIEDNEGHRISLNKVVFGRNIKFNSNKIEDRVDAVIAAVESAKGLKLKVTDITEREVRDENGATVMDAEGKPQMTKVYHFNKELVG